MDRFIAFTEINVTLVELSFKIQYGQIYRRTDKLGLKFKYIFKIQYGQIYRNIYNPAATVIKYLKSNMDRFIEWYNEVKGLSNVAFKIQYGQIYRIIHKFSPSSTKYLKSNMDRFIDETSPLNSLNDLYLKSNMDRFIVFS